MTTATEPRFNSREELEDNQSRRASYLLLLLAITLTITNVIGGVFQEGVVNPLPAMMIALALAIPSWIGAILAIRGQTRAGIIVGLLGLYFISFVSVFFTTDLGIIQSVFTFSVALTIVIQLLPKERLTQGLITVLALSIVLILADVLWPVTRTVATTEQIALQSLLAAGATLIFLFFFFRNFRDYNLQAKFVMAVTLLAVIAIGITTVAVSVSISNILTAQIGSDLANISQARASGIGEILSREIRILETLRLNQVIRRQLTETNITYLDQERNEVYQSLLDEDERWRSITPSDTEFLFNEVLSNPATRELRTFQDAFPNNPDLFITDQFGALVAATERPDAYFYGDDFWWRSAFNNGEGDVYISEPSYDAELDTYKVVLAIPIFDRFTPDVLGVIHSTYVLNEIGELIDIEVIETGEGSQVDIIFQNFALGYYDGTFESEALNNFASARISMAETDDPYVIAPVEDESRFVSESQVLSLAGIDAIDELSWYVLVHQPEVNALAAIDQQQQTQIVLGIIIVIFGVAAALIVGRVVSQPILRLASVAEEVAGGDLNARATVETGDEIATLALNFNDMANELQTTLSGLETRVAERTRALEATSRVSRSLSTLINQDELLQAVVEQLQATFNYYHVHVYLVNETGTRLEMVSGSGDAGAKLLAEGHGMNIGQGLVGQAADTNLPILVPDVSQNAGWVPNRYLPETQSEVAVPISLGDRVMGVLDVQNVRVDSLGVQDINLLQSIASQIAIGLRNAEFYSQAQREAEREALINDISQKIQNTTDIETAMKIAARELGEALDSPQATVRLNVSDKPKNGQGNGHRS